MMVCKCKRVLSRFDPGGAPIGADAVGQEDKGSPGSTRIACRRPVLLAYRKDIG